MATRVNIDKGALARFRTKARNCTKEIMAYMVGYVAGSTIVVEQLEYTSGYAHQTKTTVSWKWGEYHRVKQQAEERGHKIVGFIHSHPDDWDCVMSPADYAVCLSEESLVCGIVSVYGRTTRVRFWAINSPLPCEIVSK